MWNEHELKWAYVCVCNQGFQFLGITAEGFYYKALDSGPENKSATSKFWNQGNVSQIKVITSCKNSLNRSFSDSPASVGGKPCHIVSAPVVSTPESLDSVCDQLHQSSTPKPLTLLPVVSSQIVRCIEYRVQVLKGGQMFPWGFYLLLV